MLIPEAGLSPRVYYRNIPGKFIAGTVYDPIEKEVIVGARCLLTSGGKVVETQTDTYGDFWFKDLPIGTYKLRSRPRGSRVPTTPISPPPRT